jgi:hypothetical protein
MYVLHALSLNRIQYDKQIIDAKAVEEGSGDGGGAIKAVLDISTGYMSMFREDVHA